MQTSRINLFISPTTLPHTVYVNQFARVSRWYVLLYLVSKDFINYPFINYPPKRYRCYFTYAISIHNYYASFPLQKHVFHHFGKHWQLSNIPDTWAGRDILGISWLRGEKGTGNQSVRVNCHGWVKIITLSYYRLY